MEGFYIVAGREKEGDPPADCSFVLQETLQNEEAAVLLGVGDII